MTPLTNLSPVSLSPVPMTPLTYLWLVSKRTPLTKICRCLWHRTDKKEKKSPQKKEIQKGAVVKSYMTNCLLSPHIWLNICLFPHILGSPFSYITLQPLPSEFPYILYEENLFSFLSVRWPSVHQARDKFVASVRENADSTCIRKTDNLMWHPGLSQFWKSLPDGSLIQPPVKFSHFLLSKSIEEERKAFFTVKQRNFLYIHSSLLLSLLCKMYMQTNLHNHVKNCV